MSQITTDTASLIYGDDAAQTSGFEDTFKRKGRPAFLMDGAFNFIVISSIERSDDVMSLEAE